MLIKENLKFAFSSLWDNKIRSVLTMLGVIIGVFSVITLISIGEGLRDEFETQISDIGSNLVIVASGQIDTESSSFNPASFIGSASLTLEDVNDVKAEVPNIEKIAWTINIPGQVTYKDKVTKSPINFATQPEIIELMNMNLNSGRNITAEDQVNKNRVVILGGETKEALFNEDEEPIDKKITLLGEEFTVIGTTEKKETAVGFGDTSFNNVVIMPFETGEEIADDSSVFRILMQADSPDTVQSVTENVRNVILENHNQNDDFSVLTQEDLLGLFDDFFAILTTAISGIAAISLIVGGIGIMNIMLVSVTERTREIGIRKAIGATSANILGQFLIEAATLSIFGGALGVALSYATGQLISQYWDLPTQITLDALLLAIIISVAVGIIFGLAPAVKAARKNPIDALHYE